MSESLKSALVTLVVCPHHQKIEQALEATCNESHEFEQSVSDVP